MNVNKNFKENLGLKKFIVQNQKIDESIYDNWNNLNYCSADEKYGLNVNNNNFLKTNNFLNKKKSIKTTAINRVNKSSDLDQHLKNYKPNPLREDFSINDLINKSNEDFVKMKKILDKNSNKNSKKNLINNSSLNHNKIDIFDIDLNSKNNLNINEKKSQKDSVSEDKIDSENRNLNFLDNQIFLKVQNLNSKNYENARKKARNNYYKNNCSIANEVSHLYSNDGQIFLKTEVKNRPKSNLAEFHTYNNVNNYNVNKTNNNNNIEYINKEERINTIQDFSTSKRNF